MGNNHGKLEKGKTKEHRKKGRPTQDENDIRLVTNQGFTEETLVNSQAGKTNKIGRKPYNEDKKRKAKRDGPLTESVKKRKSTRRRYSSSEDSTDTSDPTSSSAMGRLLLLQQIQEYLRDYQGHSRDEHAVRPFFAIGTDSTCNPYPPSTCNPLPKRLPITAGAKAPNRKGHQLIGTTHNVDQYAALAQPGVFARFNFLTHNQPSCRDIWTFKPLLRFYDGEVDTAVLELEDSAQGTPMPLPFTDFGIPVLNDKFTFIGHTGGETQQLDIVNKCIDINSEGTRSTIITVKKSSLQFAARDYESPPHILAHPHRFLFNCLFSKGASGPLV